MIEHSMCKEGAPVWERLLFVRKTYEKNYLP